MALTVRRLHRKRIVWPVLPKRRKFFGITEMSPVDHPGGRKVRGRVSRAVLGSFGLQFLSMFEDRENLPILAIRANPNGRTNRCPCYSRSHCYP